MSTHIKVQAGQTMTDDNKPPLFGSCGYKFYSKYAAEKYRRMLKKADDELQNNPRNFDHNKHIDECVAFIREHGPAEQLQEMSYE